MRPRTVAKLSPDGPDPRFAFATSAIKVEMDPGWNKCQLCDIVQADGWGAAARMRFHGPEAKD